MRWHARPVALGVRVFRRRKEDPRIWTTADRRQVRVRDMEVQHLENTVRYLRRERQRRCSAYYLRTFCGLQPMGDMATEAVGIEAGVFLDLEETAPDDALAQAVPQFKTMLAECRRRRLKP